MAACVAAGNGGGVMWLVLTWIAGLALAYAVVAPLLLVAALNVMLTPGGVDWAGEGRKKPSDPLRIGYFGDPGTAFGWPFEAVRYQTELGEAEAWLIPADAPSDTWAIWVHGIGGTRENGYRMVRSFREAGLPVLMITYRNDKGAPRDADPLHSFGLAEWRDLEAAVDWMVERGALRVIVAAESMGGAITGQYLRRGSNTERIAGLALDAPALDFNEVIAAGGRRYWVPFSDYVASAGLAGLAMLRRDLREAVSFADVVRFEGPMFLAHGEGDPLVPFSTSERLVALRPDIRFWRTKATVHPMSFEEDREGYAAALTDWVRSVVAAKR